MSGKTSQDLIIELDGIEHRYLGRLALHGVSIRVRPGQVFGLLGPNGAGKTSVVRLILGFQRVQTGRLAVFGQSPSAYVRRRVGYLPERVFIPPYLTGREFLEVQGRLAGLAGADLTKAVDQVVDRVRLKEAANRKSATYSKGMLQRAGIAQAIMHKPELVILDEPNSGLDPIGVAEIREIWLEEKARGCTIFMNSHQLSEVERISDEVAILNKGVVIEGGSREALSRPSGLIRLEVSEMTDALQSYLREVDPACRIEGATAQLKAPPGDEERLFPKRIVELGGRIRQYEHKRESLEDVFKRLVGGVQ